jgi:murein DD-endopeptidase MepM/ murein hydrolase activator NlpD
MSLPAPRGSDGRVRRGALVAGGVGAVLLAGWAAGATWLLVSGDHLAARLIAHQTRMQYGYEEKLAQLRTRLEREASQRLLIQDSLESRVSELVGRQARLESRQAMLAALTSEPAPGPGLAAELGTRVEAPASAHPRSPKPAPVADDFGLRTTQEVPEPPRPAPDRLGALDRALQRLEHDQMATLEALARGSAERTARLRVAVRGLGLDPDRLGAPAPAQGGPYIPVGPSADAFEEALVRAHAARSDLARLTRVATALPLGRPTAAEMDVTSGFGIRIDPFTRGPALHAGIDFRADPGSPVRAAGAGTVVTAEYSGGYGNLVEVDHGHGVTTRYAHLSRIAVREGQSLAAGAVIGRVGSTGRSTGPHLHYETRIDGEAVDPQRFLRAGTKLQALLRAPGAALPLGR